MQATDRNGVVTTCSELHYVHLATDAHLQLRFQILADKLILKDARYHATIAAAERELGFYDSVTDSNKFVWIAEFTTAYQNYEQIQLGTMSIGDMLAVTVLHGREIGERSRASLGTITGILLH